MKLRYTSKALYELQRLLLELASRSPNHARAMQTRVRSANRLLTEYPLSGRPTSKRPLRRMILTPYPYLLFYEARNNKVIIVAIRHAARDPTSMPDA